VCGRFARHSPPEKFAALFHAQGGPDLPASYNVKPTQRVLAARNAAEGGRELVTLKWGLLPFWAKTKKLAYNTINAKRETVATSAAYRGPFKSRRILLAMDGWYEWQLLPDGKHKQPYFLHANGPCGVAGIWDRWEGEGEIIESCALITGPALPVIEHIHKRMPMIVSPEHYDAWLDPERTAAADLLPLLEQTVPVDAYPVITAVNNPKSDGAELLERRLQ
jgi:putative SOS response-associated peptidase YedK